MTNQKICAKNSTPKVHTGRWSILSPTAEKKMIALFQLSFRTSSLQIAYFPSLTDDIHMSVEFLFQI
jgi:hypothetical protein